MIFQDVECGPWCERQVIFNVMLERIALIERPDRRYIPPVAYFCSDDFRDAFKACILPGDEWYFDPFLEIAIFRNCDGEHFYTYSVTSTRELDDPTYRRIRDAVRSVLAGYIQERAAGRNVFLPEELDEKSKERQREKLEKRAIILNVAPILKALYHALMKEIRKDIRAGAEDMEIAAKYGTDLNTVKIGLHSGRNVQPAEIARAALLNYLKSESVEHVLGPDALRYLKSNDLKNKCVAELLRLEEPDDLRELVERAPQRVLHGRKEPGNLIVSKRAMLFER